MHRWVSGSKAYKDAEKTGKFTSHNKVIYFIFLFLPT